MKLRDIMTKNVQAIQAHDSIRMAAETMLIHDIGALPVYSRDFLAGVVTDRDITLKATARGLNPNRTKVEDVMSLFVETCFDDEEVEEAVKKMEEIKIRRIFVRDRDGHLVGVVSLADVALKTHDQKLVDEALERIAGHHYAYVA